MSASPGIIIQNSFFSFEEIKSAVPHLEDSYMQGNLEFCHEWLNGKKYLEIKTSGSTGQPKSIKLSREQILASVHGSQNALGLKAGMSCLICINTSYIGGKMMLIRSMEIGLNAELLIPNSLPLLDLDKEYDFYSFVPLQIENLIAGNYSDILNKGMIIIIGGGALSRKLELLIQNLDTPCYHTYGMTETASHIALRPINGPNASQYFTSLEGIKLRTNSRDCLEISGKITSHQWIATTDIVELINEREFLWKGRIDEVVNSGGIKIHTPILEKEIVPVLEKAGMQFNFFLASKKDDKLGECLIMVIESGIVPENLKKVLVGALPAHHAPREIYSLEKFSLTETGKIRKNEILRQLSVL